MNLADLRAQVHPGQGLVAHFASAVVVLAEPASGDSFTNELLSTVESGCAAFGPMPGRQLIRKLAGLVSSSEPDAVRSFGVVASADEGLEVMLCGSMEAHIESDGSPSEKLSSLDVATWVDRLVRGQCKRLVVLPSGSADQGADPNMDLRAGAVPGVGITLVARQASPELEPTPEPAPVAKAEPAPQSPEAPAPNVAAARVPDAGMAPANRPDTSITTGFVSVALSEPLGPEELRPLPIATTGGKEAPAEDESDVHNVQGIFCARGHFIDPRARFCAVCGIAMVHQTHDLVWGSRPSLGVLVLDSGATFVVDQDYIIGREPETSEPVVSGAARPLMIDDPDRQVSRVHARIRLREWDVQIEDAKSANGTRIFKPGSSDWTDLKPEEPITIGPGTRISIGPHEFVFDSHFQGA